MRYFNPEGVVVKVVGASGSAGPGPGIKDPEHPVVDTIMAKSSIRGTLRRGDFRNVFMICLNESFAPLN